MKKSNIGSLVLRVLLLFLGFEVVTQGLGSIFVSKIWHMLFFGKYSYYMIAEAVVLIFALALLILERKFYILKERRLKFFEALKLSVPILVISLFSLLGNLENLNNVNGDNLLSVFIYCILIGCFEEIFFRGIIQREITDEYSSNPKEVLISIGISSILFGLVHLTNLFAGQDLLTTMSQVIQTSAVGFLLGGIYFLSKNIWSVIFLHAFYDFSVILRDVNLIKDCGYIDNLPIEVTMQSLVVSMFLSLIYIIYAFSILRKSKILEVLGEDVSDELKEKERKNDNKFVCGILGIVGLMFIFNITYALVMNIDLDKYYICYDYPEKKFDKYEIRYYSYKEFDVIDYTLMVKDSKAYLVDDVTSKEVDLGFTDVKGVFSFDNNIIVITYNRGNYKVYYNESITNGFGLDNFMEFDMPDIRQIGILVDSDTGFKYPMFKSDTQDLFVIFEDKVWLVV